MQGIPSGDGRLVHVSINGCHIRQAVTKQSIPIAEGAIPGRRLDLRSCADQRPICTDWREKARNGGKARERGHKLWTWDKKHVGRRFHCFNLRTTIFHPSFATFALQRQLRPGLYPTPRSASGPPFHCGPCTGRPGCSTMPHPPSNLASSDGGSWYYRLKGYTNRCRKLALQRERGKINRAQEDVRNSTAPPRRGFPVLFLSEEKA